MSKIRKMFECLKRVKLSSWARLFVLAVAVINAALQIFGVEIISFGNEEAEKAATVVVLAVSALTAYWKNNSFTEAAQAADEVLRTIRRTSEK